MADVRTYRQGVSIAADGDAAHQNDLKLARFGLEVLARPLPSVYAQSLPGGVVEAFVHDWSAKLEMETAYRTSTVASSENVSEERRALLSRPHRTIHLQWQSMGRASIDRMLVVLRKMTDSRWAIPLYQDQIYLDSAYTDGPANVTLLCDHLKRRVHVGGRVVIMSFGADYIPNNVAYRIVEQKTQTGIILDSRVGFNLAPATTLIMPCLDVEYVLDPILNYNTDLTASISLTVQEIIGRSALPPSWVGHPNEYSEFDSLPIFDPNHNWKVSRAVKYARRGSLVPLGRGLVANLRGDHAQLITEWALQVDRTDFYSLLTFFDSRYGRNAPFWTIDPETVWEPAAVASGYVEIEPLGDSTDFQEDFDYVGLRLTDGTKVVREVSGFTIGATWKISVSSNFPASIVVSDIVDVARARKSRFNSDVFKESWVSDNQVTVNLETFELLEEKEITE